MKFVVDGYQITRTDHENVITTSNVESVVCEFEFANTYTDQLFAVMYRDKTLNRMVEIQNGSCVIPWELLETEGMLYIGACALSTQGPTVLKRTTSNAVAVRIQKSLYYDTVLNAMPTPELWEQIVGYRNETQEFAEQAADDAESAAQSAQRIHAGKTRGLPRTRHTDTQSRQERARRKLHSRPKMRQRAHVLPSRPKLTLRPSKTAPRCFMMCKPTRLDFAGQMKKTSLIPVI